MVKKQRKREVACNRVGLSETDPDWNWEILEEKPWEIVVLASNGHKD